MSDRTQDWDPQSYQRFGGFRLRPALDLLAQIGEVPAGPVVDLGCGAGVMARALSERFSAPVLGVDTSASMLEKALETEAYAEVTEADIAHWIPEEPPALIYSNAALNWVGGHQTLFVRLANLLAPRGVLAIQMPQQQAAPSHALLRQIAVEMFPARFDWSNWAPNVLSAPVYHEVLRGMGALNIWETEYFQYLEPIGIGHPVRSFTRSTVARPILEKLTQTETEAFLARYDAALETAYPRDAGGCVTFPFRRVFLVLTRV